VYFVSRTISTIWTDTAICSMASIWLRMLRHVAWHEPLARFCRSPRLRSRRTRVETDIRLAASLMLHPNDPSNRTTTDPVEGFELTRGAATLRLVDGSVITVPNAWSGRVTDLEVTGRLGAGLLQSTASFALLQSRVGSFPADSRRRAPS
jgi:hypothetical protein